MLKPSKDEINSEADNLVGGHLSAESQKDARLLLRQLFQDKTSGYCEQDYPRLDDKLATVAGYEAQQVLAALARHDALDQDMDRIAIQGLVTSEENNDRMGWAATILAVLYAGPQRSATFAVVNPPRHPCCTVCYDTPCVCRRRS